MKIGQKVVCITDKWYLFKKLFGFQLKIPKYFNVPKKDKIYIISATSFNTDYNYNVVQIDGFGTEWFQQICFAPIDESFAEGVLENIIEQIKQDKFQEK